MYYYGILTVNLYILTASLTLPPGVRGHSCVPTSVLGDSYVPRSETIFIPGLLLAAPSLTTAGIKEF
jgi:hypothetical protein